MKLIDVRYQDPRTCTYLGSPSLVRLPDGGLLAVHDYFGPGCPRNHESEEHLTSVYRSEDEGSSWQNITHISGAFWSSLFVHSGDVYLLGTSAQYGSVVIRRSRDGGFTWSHPGDSRNGLLLPAGEGRTPPNYHCAPTPVLEHQGRLYRAFENFSPTTQNITWRAPDFLSFVISCSMGSDLLDSCSWTVSNSLCFDPGWLSSENSCMANPGWLEGNLVVCPDGNLANILRLHSDPLFDKAALIHLSSNGQDAWFDPIDGLLDFPGGNSKFTIRQDPVTGLYITLSNSNKHPDHPADRSVLSWHVSTDLHKWWSLGVLLQDDGSVSAEMLPKQVGFQYADWQFDNDDLIYLVRTAYDGAHSFHDSNRITFHCLKQFRSYLDSRSGANDE